MKSAKIQSLPAKKAAKPAAKKAAARTVAKRAAPAAKAARRFVAFDTPLEPKHTTRQKIVEAIANAA
jgi:hypothetical protein